VTAKGKGATWGTETVVISTLSVSSELKLLQQLCEGHVLKRQVHSIPRAWLFFSFCMRCVSCPRPCVTLGRICCAGQRRAASWQRRGALMLPLGMRAVGRTCHVQSALRLQATSGRSYDLVTAVARYFVALEAHGDNSNLNETMQAIATLVDMTQGPCTENISAVISAKVVDACKRIFSWSEVDLQVPCFPSGVARPSPAHTVP
jgi:hypothetical protein